MGGTRLPAVDLAAEQAPHHLRPCGARDAAVTAQPGRLRRRPTAGAHGPARQRTGTGKIPARILVKILASIEERGQAASITEGAAGLARDSRHVRVPGASGAGRERDRARAGGAELSRQGTFGPMACYGLGPMAGYGPRHGLGEDARDGMEVQPKLQGL